MDSQQTEGSNDPVAPGASEQAFGTGSTANSAPAQQAQGDQTGQGQTIYEQRQSGPEGNKWQFYSTDQQQPQPQQQGQQQPFYDGQQNQQQPVYNGQQYVVYPQQGYVQTAAAPLNDNSTELIIFSVIEIILGGILAIVPLIYSIKFKDAMASHNYQEAFSAHKTARTWLIVLAIVIGVILVFAIVAVIFGIMADSGSLG